MMSQSSSGNSFASVISSPHKWQKPLFQIWNKTGTNFYEKNLSRLSPDCFRPRGDRNYIKGTQSIPIGGFKLVRFPTYFIFMFVGKPDWFKLGISEIGNWKYYNVYKPKMEWKNQFHELVRLYWPSSNCPVNWARMPTPLIGRQCLHRIFSGIRDIYKNNIREAIKKKCENFGPIFPIIKW